MTHLFISVITYNRPINRLNDDVTLTAYHVLLGNI